ncbi:MAG: hydrolase [Candidatus Aenigmatarchaeota archaeon]
MARKAAKAKGKRAGRKVTRRPARKAVAHIHRVQRRPEKRPVKKVKTAARRPVRKPKAAARRVPAPVMPKSKLLETGCCKRFDPAPWDEKEVTWKGKLFLKDSVFTLFNIPLNMGGVMKKNHEIITSAKAYPETPVMLYDCSGPFGADVYIEVTKEIKGAKTERISGTFLSKVFEGPFNKTGAWMSEMKKFTEAKGKKAEKFYTFYTTCPSCAKVYGKNYTVILAKI